MTRRQQFKSKLFMTYDVLKMDFRNEQTKLQFIDSLIKEKTVVGRIKKS